MKTTKAQRSAWTSDVPDQRWCSDGHYAPTEEFARCKKHGWQRLCKKHHRERVKEWRARHPGYQSQRYREDPEFRKKVRARHRVQMRKLRGQIDRQPCEACGNPDAQTHHDDYDRPLDVRWLCARCHGSEHYPDASTKAESASRLRSLIEKHCARADARLPKSKPPE